jgi:hypothetical protein
MRGSSTAPESEKVDGGVCRLWLQNRVAWRRFLACGKRETKEGSSGFKREGLLGPLLHGREREKWGSWAHARGEVERGWG